MSTPRDMTAKRARRGVRRWALGGVAGLLAASALGQGLTYAGAAFDGFGAEGLDGAISAAVSPDGQNLYVTGLEDDAIAVFAVATNSIFFIQLVADGVGGVDGLDGAAGIAVSPDGLHVYATGAEADTVVVFERGGSGTLSFLEWTQAGGVALDGAAAVAVSPAGDYVYVVGVEGDGLAAFSRDDVDGDLTLIDLEFDGLGSDGLDGAIGVAVAPDRVPGADWGDVYVVGNEDSAVVQFQRSTSTGALTFVEAWFDGFEGVDGIGGAISVAVSPDGRNVYVAGLLDSAVATFARSPSTGSLTYLGAAFDGFDGVDGIGSAAGVAVSPGGEVVLVSGLVDDAVALFARNAVTGELTFVDAVFDGFEGVDGLDGAFRPVFAPGGTTAYVPANEDDAVAVLAVSLFASGFESGNTSGWSVIE